jgi:hypothetical protein
MRTLILPLILSIAAVACSSSTTTSSSPGGGGGSTPVTTQDCTTGCKNKGTQCGGTADQVNQYCANLCGGQVTQEQMTCLQSKSCDELAKAQSLDTLCPKTTTTTPPSSGGGTAQLGDSCKCEGVSASSEGLCSGTNVACASGLSCVYASGSNGQGKCMGARCCDDTNACDQNPSLLKACRAGTCKSASIGYYCQK